MMTLACINQYTQKLSFALIAALVIPAAYHSVHSKSTTQTSCEGAFYIKMI